MNWNGKKGIGLALAVILTLAAACSGNQSGAGGNTAAENASPPQAAPTEASDQTREEEAPAQPPADDRSKRFTVELDRSGSSKEPPLEQNPVKLEIQNDLNIDFVLRETPGTYNDWLKSYSTRIATGDLSDIVMANRPEFIKFANDGLLIPLDDLLETVPALKNRLTEEEWLGTSVDGSIYAIPTSSKGGNLIGMYIRKDWLDRLQLPIPTTTEQLFDVLRAFTFDDPDGNGQDDTFGLTINLGNWSASNLTNAFGLPQWGATVRGVPEDWIDGNGVMHFGPISDEYRNYLTYLNRLAAAKVLDPDIPTNTQELFNQKIVQGQVGAAMIQNPQNFLFASASPALLKQIKAADPNAEWVYMSPVKGPDGASGNNAYFTYANKYFSITKQVLEEPGKAERIIQLMNYMFTDGLDSEKGGLMKDFGLEGTHHRKENGKIVEIFPNLRQDQVDFLYSYALGGLNPNLAADELLYSAEDYALQLRMLEEDSHGNFIPNHLYQDLPFVYDGNKYINEMSLKFIYGQEDLGQWDAYVQTLRERYRYDEVMEIRAQQMRDLGVLK